MKRTPIVDHDTAEADDFEKGGHDGQEEALEVCARALAAAVAHVRSSRAGRETKQP